MTYSTFSQTPLNLGLVASLMSLSLMMSCTSTVPTKVGTQFELQIATGFVDAETAARLKRVEVATHQKDIKVGFGEATVTLVVETIRDPQTTGAFIRSAVVEVSDNDAWDISASVSGQPLNRGTHQKPLQGIAVLITAMKETTWKKRSTQTMVDILGDGTFTLQ